MKLPPPRDDAVWARIRQHDVEELWDHSKAPHVAAAYRNRIDLLRAKVRSVTPPGGRVLDVGAAQGTLGLELAEDGYRVTLLDVRSECIEYARCRYERGVVEFVTGRLSSTCPPSFDFDTVTCTEVLEHATAPSELLLALRAKLRIGGYLVVTTPNANYGLSRLPSFSRASASELAAAEPDSLDGDAHAYLYTRDELVSLVRGAGLHTVSHGYFSPFYLVGHLKTRYLHRAAYRLRGRLAMLRAVSTRLGARFLCSSQWLLATRKG